MKFTTPVSAPLFLRLSSWFRCLGVPIILVVATLALSAFAAQPGKTQQLTTPDQMPEGLAKSDWSSIREAYEAGRHAFHRQEDGAFAAQNPGQGWQMKFDGSGFTATPSGGGWTWGLELTKYGFTGHEHQVSSKAVASPSSGRLEYQRDEVMTEWFINDQRGLEQGWTLQKRPATDVESPLRLELKIRGGLKAEIAEGGAALRFLSKEGGTVLTFGGLRAWDADQRLLPVEFISHGDGANINIEVDEQNARYPITIDPIAQQAYLKASNTGAEDRFGISVAVSGDTVVIGAYEEDSNATGVDATLNGSSGPQADNSALGSGAAYVFTRSGTTWTQQAYLKASNTNAGDYFGSSVAVEGDTVVVGAYAESSNATGVDAPLSGGSGTQADNSATWSGAAYVFTRSGTTWTQQAYLKASNTGANDRFGRSVAVTGNTVVVGAYGESSNATGVDATVNGSSGPQADNSASASGAAYVFTRSGTTWTQQAYLKASNTGQGDSFGSTVAASGDTVVVGAYYESSNATGVNALVSGGSGTQADNSANTAGAAYVFTRSGTTWTQQAYLKASNTGQGDFFSSSLAASGDTVVVGAFGEDSNATGVDISVNGSTGPQADNSANSAGAAYVFTRSGTTWTQQAYLKASNTGTNDSFGGSVAISGSTLVVGAYYESSNATEINAPLSGGSGTQADNSALFAGAAYVFTRSGTTWTQQAYLKASNSEADDEFGASVAVAGDTVIVGAWEEDSNATGFNAPVSGGSGTQANNSAGNSGATYIFTGLGTVVTAPNMAVKSNGMTIQSDPVGVPSLSNYTDFGSVNPGSASAPQSFAVTNTGPVLLNLTGTPNKVVISGTHSNEFIASQPASPVAATNGSNPFTITFAPGASASGLRTARVSIDNNDPTKNPYTFNIQGTASIGTSGTVVAWGNNAEGQTTRTVTTSSPYSAIAKPVVNLSGVTALAAGKSHTVALKNDGTVEVWGDNTYGQQYVPAGLSEVRAIAAGESHIVALRNDGTLWAWGNNRYGQVTGIATTNAPYIATAHPVMSPPGFASATSPEAMKGVKAIAAGKYHTVALKNDGTVEVWGDNTFHQKDVTTGLSGVIAIAAGKYHTVALKNDGTVVTSGGVLGVGDVPPDLSSVIAIAAGEDHTIALKKNGTVVVWGDNTAGQKNVPAGLNGVTAIAAGGFHCVALKNDGRVAVWGYNSSGQVSGTPTAGYAPANPVTLQSEILSGVTAIAAGGSHTLAVIGDNTPVLTMHRADPVSALPDGVIEPFPLVDIDLPLIPKTATSILKSSCTTPISGLVCDGVTPLLFKLKNRGTTSATEYDISISVVPGGGGTVTDALAKHLHVLSNGQWAPTTDIATGPVRLTVPAPASGQTFSESYGYISAIPAESLALDTGSKEVVCLLSVQQKNGLVDVGPPMKTTLYLRRPPIALVHGYNTTGEWGAAFKDELMPGGATDPFIVQIQYGVKDGTNTTENTFGHLSDLSGKLSDQFKVRLDAASAPLRSNWAYTRYDVVGHSQGGVLSRMLCSIKKDNPGGPFRSASNNFRGRFRRIVTIGSPHNGSRLIHYLLEYERNLGFIPTFLNFYAHLFQPKFDPWGDEIKALNDPGGNWVPDGSAKFFMVRTTINNGQAPGFLDLVPAYQLTALSSQRGAVVLPSGSDGAVDLESQGFLVLDGNVHTLPSASNIAHAGPLGMFNAPENQVKSADVAAVVQDALDDDKIASLNIFKAFVMPPLLIDTVKNEIDAVAPSIISDTLAITRALTLLSQDGQLSGAASDSASSLVLPLQSSYAFTLSPPTGYEVSGNVSWNAEVFGPNGVTTDGVTLTVNPLDSREVTVVVEATVVGDVMLYARYATAGGSIVLAGPIKVVSMAPAGVTLSSLFLRPTSVSLPAGISLPLELWAGYSDGSKRQVYTGGDDVTFTSLNTTVADVTANGTATLKTAGTAIVQATYQGITVVGQITVSSGSVPVVPVVANLTGAEGQPFQYQFTASNAPTYFGASGLPPGLTMNDKTGLLSGTPTASGVFTLSIAAANPAGVSLSRAVQLTVSPAPAAAPVIVVEQPAGVAQEDGTANIAFGSIHLGSNNTKVFTIRNNGVDDMTGLAVTKTGTHSGDFIINTTGMSAMLPAGGNTTFNVTFAPTASGARTAALQIASNLSGTQNPFDLALSGSGLVVNTSTRDVDTGFNPVIVGNYVKATVVQPDGKTIIAGYFSSVNGVPRSNIARLNADGSTDMGFDPKANATVRCVVVQADGKILLGGSFTTLQPNGALSASPRNYIARVNADGSLDAGFDPSANDWVVSVVVQANNQILLGGYFTALQPNGSSVTTPRQSIARVNADGSLDMTFDPKADDYVTTLAVQVDGRILIGGGFSTLQPNGATTATPRHSIARVYSDGSLDVDFDPKANSTINCVAVQADGKILLGGWFSSLQPNGALATTERNRIARINADGGLDIEFNPNADSTVDSIAVQADGKVLLGGWFSTLQPNGALTATPRRLIARVNANGSLDSSFDPKADNVVTSVAVQADGLLLLGGFFTTLQPNGAVSATDRNVFARLNNDATTQGIIVPDTTQAQWQRGGASPELTQVTFDLSNNGGASWTTIGNGTRVGVTANWQLTGVSLPTTGQLRARGRNVGGAWNGSSGVVETVVSYTAPNILSTNANLTNLLPSAGTLAPDFSATTTNYAFSVSNATTAITVTPTKADANATIQVRVNGGSYATVPSGSASASLPLNLGINTIDTLVTAQDGTTTKTYTLTVRRQSNDATLAALSFSGMTLSPLFAAGTTSYTASVPFSIANTVVSATTTNGLAMLTSGTGIKGLAVGINTLEIIVTAEDGTTATYTVAVTRASPAPEIVVEDPAANNLVDNDANVSFGNVNVGSSGSAQIFTIRNTGAANLSGLTVSKNGAHAVDFTVANLGLATLAPFESTTFTVIFSPTASGPRNAAIHIGSNDPDENPFDIAIAGTGLLSRTMTGTTAGKPTWTRPNENGNSPPLSLSTSATTVPYEAISFTVENSGSYTLISTATVPAAWDNYMFLYSNVFDALAPLSNVVIGNDDYSGIGVSGFTINLQAGIIYHAVNTGYRNTYLGSYSLVITGPGYVALKPTVTTSTASVTATSATLSGMVNANLASATVTFDYGQTTAYGSSVTAAPSQVAGSTDTAVSATVNGLIPGTTYQYRTSATNAVGTNKGDDLTFTTLRNNANLSALALSAGTVAFDPLVVTYNVTVANAVNSITVTPTVADNSATVKVNNVSVASGGSSAAITLVEGINPTINILVAAEDGTTKNYAVIYSRLLLPMPVVLAATDVSKSMARLNGTVNARGTNTVSTFEYGLDPNLNTSFITASATPGTVTGSTATSISANVTGLIPNSVYYYRIRAVSAGGTQLSGTQTFTTALNDAYLTNLTTSFGSLSPFFSPTSTAYTAMVGYDTFWVVFTPTAPTPSVLITVNGSSVSSGNNSPSINLATGDNTITVMVTDSELSVSRTYTITVTRQTGPPSIVTQPLSQFAFVGASMSFSPQFNGAGPLSYVWKKNNVILKGATLARYDIPVVTTAHAGRYVVEVTNSLGKRISNEAVLGVISRPPSLVNVLEKGTLTLAAPAVAPTGVKLTYEWWRAITPLSNGGRISGTNTATMRITGMAPEDENSYWCYVSMRAVDGSLIAEGYTEGTGVHLTEIPEIYEGPLPDGAVSALYSTGFPFDSMSARKTPSSYTATGLPAGLKCDPKTGDITGRPTAARKDKFGAVIPYDVTLTARNAKGADTLKTTLRIEPLPDSAVGNFAASLDRHAGFNAGLGGRLDMTILSTGILSGKVVLGTATWPFTGVLEGGSEPTGTLMIKRKIGEAPLTFSFSLFNGYIDGLLDDNVHSLYFSGSRQVGAANANLYAGYYTFSILPAGYSSNLPHGAGYGSFTVSKTGTLALTGRMADGEAITGGSFVGVDGSIVVYQTLYTTVQKGSLQGYLRISNLFSDKDLSDWSVLSWMRPKNTAITARLFVDGFGPENLHIRGSEYTPPLTGQIVMGLPDVAGNAMIIFSPYTTQSYSFGPSINLRIKSGGSIVLPLPADNPAKTSLSIVPATGAFSGGFTLVDPNPLPPPALPRVITRTVRYQGIIFNDRNSSVSIGGGGYFLLPELPSTDSANVNLTPIIPGNIYLWPQ